MRLKDYKDSPKEILKDPEKFPEELKKAEEELLEEENRQKETKQIDIQQLFFYSKRNSKI